MELVLRLCPFRHFCCATRPIELLGFDSSLLMMSFSEGIVVDTYLMTSHRLGFDLQQLGSVSYVMMAE